LEAGSASESPFAVEQAILPAAIVGGGAGGFIAHVSLRFSGLPERDVAVYDDRESFLQTWTSGTGAIQQRTMRSESDGHFFATDFPGFALMEAIDNKSPLPLLKSVINRYNPTLGAVVRHGQALSWHYRFEQSIHPIRIARIRRQNSPVPHFELFDADERLRGRASHVLLALVHGPARWPEVLSPEVRSSLEGTVFHAYQPKAYGGKSALIIGSGMSAVTEWSNVLREGGSVIAVHRSPTLTKRALSAPRCTFGGPWLDGYQALAPQERLAALADIGQGSFPGTGSWRRVVRDGERQGKLESIAGDVLRIEKDPDGRAVLQIRGLDGGTLEKRVDMVIAATGFESGCQNHAILRDLIRQYQLQSHDDTLVVNNDCSVPGISDERASLFISGPEARWAFPAADSFGGLKYAARRFSANAVGAQPWPKHLASWLDMVRGGWARSPRDGEDKPDQKLPCATP
ncbi:MAG: hypothetical protein ACRDFX_13215, partial [Chloroflexota bacterium]